MKKDLLSVILALVAIIPMKSWAQEPYAVLSQDNTVLTFYYDNQKEARNGMDVVGPFKKSYNAKRERMGVDSGWDDQREMITTVVFDASFRH